MTTHADHHFSVTVTTNDVAVLYCLRALADLAQATGNTRIVWGGTKKEDWQRSGGSVTFRFSQVPYRGRFMELARRVLPQDSWSVVRQSDADPAAPQS